MSGCNMIGIRHWDGYWFGRERQWGDVFPHYWSALTAVALRQLPEGSDSGRAAESDAAATQIFRANLLNVLADGSATCAFVCRAASTAGPRTWPIRWPTTRTGD